jgi:AcrR family transcriptional regulator
MSRQDERSEATRTALIAAGRELFSERGYAEVGTEEIVRTAGVTRGALYHHFKDKAQLFAAVLDHVEDEISATAESKALEVEGPWEQLRVVCHAFLDAYTGSKIERIAVLDAASVLGSEGWCSIVHNNTVRVLRERIQAAIDAGVIEDQPVEALAHLLLGGLNVSARVIARADDIPAARAMVGTTIDRILNGVRGTVASDV